MVKAIRIHETGGPEVFKLEDVEVAAPGAGEIQIRQRAIGVNYLDVYYRTGLYPAALPFIPGNEGAGDVIAIGKGVKEFKVGDRVGYAGPLGGYAEVRNLPAAIAVKLTKDVSYEQAAGLMLKGLTAQYLLRQVYKVKKGDTILVHAAAGGVGSILCQWGKALGATVIGTVGSEEKAKLAKKFGAKHTILYRSEDWVARVKEITKGKLCDVVYDGVGKDTFPGSLDCIRPLGMFASFGSASGPIEAFNIGVLGQKGSLFATRPTLFTYLADPARKTKMARDLMKVVADGVVKIPITGRLKLAEAQKAHQLLQGRDTTGMLVLVP
ncbi:MAG: quinone oxidoreductase [Hyphomicrobiales bacterium]|nr:quinone oxidoreductase [Hyphomicrobiales bacterium]